MEELNGQVELALYNLVPSKYFNQFEAGAVGLYNRYLLESPNYKGDKDLKTYLQYQDYTIHYLEETIRFANECLSKVPFVSIYSPIKKAAETSFL